MSSEHSFSNEPQNSATSNRILLPLEPDFSQMSDPSTIIDPSSNTWKSTDRHTSQTREVGEISLKENTNLRRGEDIDHLLSPLVYHPLWLLIGKAKGVVGWCKGVVYLTSPGRQTDIGLQLGKACYPCSR